MPYPKLGCLERVGLETRWDGEPSGFAPWFLDSDRLGMLGDALGLRLEPVLGALTRISHRFDLPGYLGGSSVMAVSPEWARRGSAGA